MKIWIGCFNRAIANPARKPILPATTWKFNSRIDPGAAHTNRRAQLALGEVTQSDLFESVGIAGNKRSSAGKIKKSRRLTPNRDRRKPPPHPPKSAGLRNRDFKSLIAWV